MCSFADVPGVLITLAELAQADPPFVEELPREPGRSSNRWRHLLSAEAEQTAAPASAAPSVSAGVTATSPAASTVGETADPPAAATAAPATVAVAIGDDLTDRLASLERRVAALEARLGDERNRG